MRNDQTLECDVLVVGGGLEVTPHDLRGLGTKAIWWTQRPGGTCLLRGCIPSKAFIHAASEFQSVASAATEDNPYSISINPLLILISAGWKILSSRI